MLKSKDLLGIEFLQPQDIYKLLNLAESFTNSKGVVGNFGDNLNGTNILSIFFETSTRTQTSFEIAGKRLGAFVTNVNINDSAMKKGETLFDTALTLNAMKPDLIIIRHPSSGAVQLLSEKIDCSVINKD